MNVKTITIAAALLLILTGNLFAHAGEVHAYMGTITAAEGESFTLKTTKGESVSFVTASATTYRFADNSPAERSDIAVGSRVVVEISKDGKTATSVKLARKK